MSHPHHNTNNELEYPYQATADAYIHYSQHVCAARIVLGLVQDLVVLEGVVDCA